LPEVAEAIIPNTPVVKVTPAVISNSISATEYVDHVQLSLSQLETVTLMLSVLEQANGGKEPIE